MIVAWQHPEQRCGGAAIEKAERVAVVPVSMGWNDVGSWDALYAISDLRAAGNPHSSRAPVR